MIKYENFRKSRLKKHLKIIKQRTSQYLKHHLFKYNLKPLTFLYIFSIHVFFKSNLNTLENLHIRLFFYSYIQDNINSSLII